MIGERDDIVNETEYGTLTMRSYDIDGNAINAFYDNSDDLIFVLDNTINQNKPNVLLVINPMGDKKWDEILAGEYDVDLETIRPKQDNKYQKLDIEYSGLSVYENLINAYVAGDDLTEHLNQLNILRDSAARHSAMIRLNVANETISKTNVTIVKTKETIVRLQERVKTLRAKLSAQKKEIGKVPTKQSASKILKLEAQIDATNEKLKRAKKRLASAQKRLEVATVDAELASDLLNQPALEIQQTAKSKNVIVAPKHEVQKIEPEEIEDNEEFTDDFESDDTDVEDVENTEEDTEDEEEDVNADNDIKPLFDKDPEILNEDIAFKPITFEAPALNMSQPEESEPVFNKEDISEKVPEIKQEAPRPMLDSMVPVQEEVKSPEVFDEPRPVLESMTPVDNVAPVVEHKPEVPLDVPPIVSSEPQYSRPVPPIMPAVNAADVVVADKNTRSKPTFVYYLLLVILIVLSIFTLWLYQKHAGTTGKPLLTAVVSEKVVEEPLPETTKEVVADKVETIKPEKVKGAEEFVFDDEDFEAEEAETENASNQEETESVAEPEQEAIAEETEVEEDVETEDEVIEESAEPVVMDAVPANIMPTNDSDEEEIIAEDAEEVDVDKPEYDVGSKSDNMVVSEQEYQEPVDDQYESDEEDFYEE